ncbi:uncharacterized protein LY89DRAFT_286196 [Mollisia scopiformis]|uniref:Uncharacterized protein n=1 Tax=Mollisia scopiformis TaxID=149040 RepID=A0A132BCL7_MOLSC|nr:uncharacterized protein LY89DRAFT_286196 [Mollisia scopiformis]KUJ09397.1 hypothetical protein LY89DRAFT_286196 [Mollisia scopiformis]
MMAASRFTTWRRGWKESREAKQANIRSECIQPDNIPRSTTPTSTATTATAINFPQPYSHNYQSQAPTPSSNTMSQSGRESRLGFRESDIEYARKEVERRKREEQFIRKDVPLGPVPRLHKKGSLEWAQGVNAERRAASRMASLNNLGEERKMGEPVGGGSKLRHCETVGDLRAAAAAGEEKEKEESRTGRWDIGGKLKKLFGKKKN